jgi:hypothetical protein
VLLPGCLHLKSIAVVLMSCGEQGNRRRGRPLRLSDCRGEAHAAHTPTITMRHFPDAPSGYPEKLIEQAEDRARMSTFQRDELLTQSKILEKETSPPAKEAAQQSPTKRSMVTI